MSESIFRSALIAMPIALGFYAKSPVCDLASAITWAATLRSKEAVESKRVKGV
jgi:hypothetical protein